jgi:hypothetical protein
VIESVLAAQGRGPALHAHPAQEERIQVVRGALRVRIDGRETLLEAGQRATVAAGAAHTYWNAGTEPVCLVAEIRPALQLESFLETLSQLPASARLARLLQLAVVAEAHRDTVRTERPHPLVLRGAAAVGRAFGFEPYHEKGAR